MALPYSQIGPRIRLVYRISFLIFLLNQSPMSSSLSVCKCSAGFQYEASKFPHCRNYSCTDDFECIKHDILSHCNLDTAQCECDTTHHRFSSYTKKCLPDKEALNLLPIFRYIESGTSMVSTITESSFHCSRPRCISNTDCAPYKCIHQYASMNLLMGRCECPPEFHPVSSSPSLCIKPVPIGGSCLDSRQCQYITPNSYCSRLDGSICECSLGHRFNKFSNSCDPLYSNSKIKNHDSTTQSDIVSAILMTLTVCFILSFFVVVIYCSGFKSVNQSSSLDGQPSENEPESVMSPSPSNSGNPTRISSLASNDYQSDLHHSQVSFNPTTPSAPHPEDLPPSYMEAVNGIKDVPTV